MSAQDRIVEAMARAALKAWQALPDDERNGERPYITGFNAGWEAAIEQAASLAAQTKAYDYGVQKSAGCNTTGQRIATAIRALDLGKEEG